MTQIPGIVSSVAQSQLTQKTQSARKDSDSQASERAAQQAKLRDQQQHEFVRDMAEATGLKVDADGKNEQEARKRKRFMDMRDQGEEDSVEIAAESDEEQADAKLRQHAEALLCEPNSPSRVAPPFMLDIEA